MLGSFIRREKCVKNLDLFDLVLLQQQQNNWAGLYRERKAKQKEDSESQKVKVAGGGPEGTGVSAQRTPPCGAAGGGSAAGGAHGAAGSSPKCPRKLGLCSFPLNVPHHV